MRKNLIGITSQSLVVRQKSFCMCEPGDVRCAQNFGERRANSPTGVTIGACIRAPFVLPTPAWSHPAPNALAPGSFRFRSDCAM